MKKDQHSEKVKKANVRDKMDRENLQKLVEKEEAETKLVFHKAKEDVVAERRSHTKRIMPNTKQSGNNTKQFKQIQNNSEK